MYKQKCAETIPQFLFSLRQDKIDKETFTKLNTVKPMLKANTIKKTM